MGMESRINLIYFERACEREQDGHSQWTHFIAIESVPIVTFSGGP